MSNFIDPATALQASQAVLQVITDTMQVSTSTVTALYEVSKTLLTKLLSFLSQLDLAPLEQKEQEEDQQKEEPKEPSQPKTPLTPEEEKMTDRMVAIAAIEAIRRQGQLRQTSTGEPLLMCRCGHLTITATPDLTRDSLSYHLYSSRPEQQVDVLPFQENSHDNTIVFFATPYAMTLQERVFLVETFCQHYEQAQTQTQGTSQEVLAPEQVQADGLSDGLKVESEPLSQPNPVTIDLDLEIVIRANVYVAQQMPESKLLEKDIVTSDGTGGIQIEKGGKVGTSVMTLGLSGEGNIYAARRDLHVDQKGNLQTTDPNQNRSPTIVYQSDQSGNALVNRVAEVNQLLPNAMNFQQVAQVIRDNMPKLKDEIAQAKQATKSGGGLELI